MKNIMGTFWFLVLPSPALTMLAKSDLVLEASGGQLSALLPGCSLPPPGLRCKFDCLGGNVWIFSSVIASGTDVPAKVAAGRHPQRLGENLRAQMEEQRNGSSAVL